MKIDVENPQAVLEDILTRMNKGEIVERKTGKWVRNSNGTYSCSLCQSWIPNEQRHYAYYCLCCGANMREEKNDE